MCGRFILSSPVSTVTKHFGVPSATLIDHAPQYNIPPSSQILVVRENARQSELTAMRWGLIPSWAKTASISNKLSNARAETVESKPAFRSAFKHRRCLIPADGFYEWRKLADRKQPYFIHLLNDALFGFAGLWESWHDPDAGEVQSCTIITTEANAVMAPLHNRMPVIVDPADYDLWLSNEQFDMAELKRLLQPYPADEMAVYPVSSAVNSPRNQGSHLITPLPVPDGSDYTGPATPNSA